MMVETPFQGNAPMPAEKRPAILLVVDLQLALDDPRWAADGPRNNKRAEARAAALLADWRRRGAPLVHIRHDSLQPDSTYRPGGPGHPFKPQVQPLAGEAIVAKSTPSAFIGTRLDERLRVLGEDLVVCGAITNNSVEATVRHAAGLGYRVRVAADACFTFAKRDWTGRRRPAKTVHDLSLANLAGEYASVLATADILANP
jgi:nicotinamidase-related amidase